MNEQKVAELEARLAEALAKRKEIRARYAAEGKALCAATAEIHKLKVSLRFQTDPEFRRANMAAVASYQKKRYANDPEYRAKKLEERKAYQRKTQALAKAAIAAGLTVDATG